MADIEPPEEPDPIARLKPGARIAAGHPRLVHDATGRIPRFMATDEHRAMVLILVANGNTLAIVAQALNINRDTLSKHFKREIRDAKAMVVARVGAAVVKEALAGNIAAAKYWLQTHGGPEWRLPVGAAEPPDPDGTRDDERVHFYMPSNGRDEPEVEEEPPVIDGEAVTGEAESA